MQMKKTLNLALVKLVSRIIKRLHHVMTIEKNFGAVNGNDRSRVPEILANFSYELTCRFSSSPLLNSVGVSI
jgi:hypothetical protein